MAFTSGIRNAGSDAGHAVEVQACGQVQKLPLYNRPGNDMLPNKGDLWKINFGDFRFTSGCITLEGIQRVSIIESSNDGWNIDSIVTLVKDYRSGVQTLTQSRDVNRRIDGNDHYTHRRLELMLA